ncbi:hypothetical protein A3B18_01655 [Candidatus Giovannonibacteria bacterium RIFCSPLOWO2_01_FULL_46_13]|uniref:Uncharacterized protein n=1 Tax=Candidatus Giovannonibacteria bacterium RIFCSPLOWO2_01_FULL_46_13 TaxID=1798352 RepID=A0A1F5X5H3_9BACT|nr:MAG: hypothetical protein A3B18_01655 [Candidatus Giovannonibacteria bacterium RIFCSPLOWO2_01_FULL_46_13]
MVPGYSAKFVENKNHPILEFLSWGILMLAGLGSLVMSGIFYAILREDIYFFADKHKILQDQVSVLVFLLCGIGFLFYAWKLSPHNKTQRREIEKND